jgi:hypothetical protein
VERVVRGVRDDGVDVPEQQQAPAARARHAQHEVLGVAGRGAGEALHPRGGRRERGRERDALLRAVHVARRRGDRDERLQLPFDAAGDLVGCGCDPGVHGQDHSPAAANHAGMQSAVITVDILQTHPEPGREAAFLVLLAFICSFGFIRTSARLTRSVSWWPGGVETEGGVHLHHLVWGNVLILVSGFAAFATEMQSPWWQILSIAFGIGAGFTLDEFALWVRLQDVYWSEEGRASLDAVVLATVFAGLVVIGVNPYGLDDAGSIVGTTGWVVLTLVMAGFAFFKGRILLGMLAIFFPFLAGTWALIRLAKPHSPWAKRYDEAKLARARKRYGPDTRGARFGKAFLNAIGGRTSEPDPPSQLG